jgi:hypothetical protein
MENDYYNQNNLIKFVEKSGLQYLFSHSVKPIEYFNLFFTPSRCVMIVKETNRYNDKSRTVNWYPITILQMKAFVAVLLAMGITRKPKIY